MKLFVGIDISSKDLVTSMISEETTEIVFQGNFVNDLKGATELKNTIINTPNSNHLDQVVIGMEATSIYSFHPAMFFGSTSSSVDQEISALHCKIGLKESSARMVPFSLPGFVFP